MRSLPHTGVARAVGGRAIVRMGCQLPFRTAAFLQIGFQNDGLHVITPLRMLFCLKVMMRHIRAIRCLSRVFMNMKKWIIDDSFKKVQYRLLF